jgi:ATP-dependent DNA helicase DinG
MSSLPPFQLQHLVSAALGPGGALAQSAVHYQDRPGQMQMAAAVADAIEQHQTLVVEAGTGVGKTFAYLVPALLSGRRVLISTATKALQDQLCQRDLPALLGLLQLPHRVRLLKGRGNYLCQMRLVQAWQRIAPTDRYLAQRLGNVQEWAQATTTGDLDELPELDELSPLRRWVTSTTENCAGNSCAHIGECHFYNARRLALTADVVVVNHHLFFADLALKNVSDAQLLPSMDVVVLDEAHHLLDVGVQFMGRTVGTRAWWDWLQEVVQAVQQQAVGLEDWLKLCARFEAALQQVEEAARRHAPAKKAAWPPASFSVSSVEWSDLAQALSRHADVLNRALAQDGASPPWQALAAQGLELRERWDVCTRWGDEADQTQAEGTAAWWESGAHPKWTQAPLSLAGAGLFGTLQSVGSGMAPDQGAWVFTSATLAMGDRFDAFTEPLGLTSARTLQVPSPFDYAYQAALFVPPDLPDPGSPDHSRALATAIWPWVLTLCGRTLVLTTTLRAQDAIGGALMSLAARDLGPEVLSPGLGVSKRELLERFRRAGQPGGAGAVMVASYSFWEGVDLPGDCLQMVVIDKLPFPPPDDPWVQAQSQSAAQQGRSPFKAYHLPEAALALKQGVGRLIRSETDHGLLVLGDVRLRQRGYGKALLRSLPPMRMLTSDAEVQAVLDDLVTRASTKDLPWT